MNKLSETFIQTKIKKMNFRGIKSETKDFLGITNKI